ncbi:hypothetical protein D3C76_1816230 [compost metagenome]
MDMDCVHIVPESTLRLKCPYGRINIRLTLLKYKNSSLFSNTSGFRDVCSNFIHPSNNVIIFSVHEM